MTRFVPADPPPLNSPFDTSPEGGAGGDRPEEIAAGFPRHLTRGLLDEASAGERRRQAIQIGLFVVALTLFALAQPHLRWIGRSLAWREWRLSTLPAGWVHPSPSLQFLESAEFFAAALLAAATLAVFVRMGKHCGLSFGRALATAAIGVLAPAAFVAARIPGPEARGLFASALLFLFLLRVGERSRSRILVTCVVAVFLDPATLVLTPAVLAASGWKRAPWLLGLLVPALLFGAPAALAPSPAWPPFLALHGLTGLGILLPLLVAPFLIPRSELEEPPPSWMGLWIIGAALSPWEGAPLLVAPALFGLQDLLGRRREAEPASTLQRALLPLLVLQILCAIGLDSWVRRTDPRRAWRENASTILRPGDVVLTDSPESLHLLTVRGGMSVYWLPISRTDPAPGQIEASLEKAGPKLVLDLVEWHSVRLQDALPLPVLKNARRLRR